jgi:NADH-ubiquinone oxidoreductase chain 4
MLLSSLLLVPILGIVTLIGLGKTQTKNLLRTISLSATIINLFISIIILLLFDNSTNQFQFVQEYYSLNQFDIHLGVDGLSIFFVILTTIIMPIALLSN